MQYKKKEYGFNIITENKNVEQYDKEKYESAKQTIYENPVYTEDALIIQAILEYSIEFGTENYFTRKDITEDHLFPKHKEIFSKIKDKSKDDVKKAYIQQTIETYLEKLIELELIESKPYECKNQEISIQYSFTSLGRMIAFLLLCNRTKKDKETANHVVDQIYDYYNSLNNSHSKFCLTFLKHCKLNNWFDTVLRYMIDLLLNASADKDEFLNKIKFLNTVFIDERLIMWKIFEKSLEHLSKVDYYTYELFLLHFKLSLEEIEEYKSRKFKDFEIERLDKCQELDAIVLEGYCSYCKEFTIKPMKITVYFPDYIKSCFSKRSLSSILCPICNKGHLDFERIVGSQSPLGHFDTLLLYRNKANEENLIRKVFEFDQKENEYTAKAQQYQWIIQFLSDDGIYYNITETQEWVLSKVPHLFNVDPDETSSEKKKKTNGLFNRHIDNLEKWNIIESIPDRSSRGGVNTRKFHLSIFGKLVASIIETILNEDKRSGYDKLFDSWKTHLAAHHSSLNSFCLLYLDNCKERELFYEFTDFYLKSFTSGKNRQVQNTNDLFTQMIFVKFEDNNMNSILFDIWQQSFKDLDEENRRLFSYYMKIYLNRNTLSQVMDFGEYEIKRFEVKDKIDQVIAEARCILCADYQYVTVNVVSYLSHYFDHPDENITDLLTKCKNCGEVVIISDFE